MLKNAKFLVIIKRFLRGKVKMNKVVYHGSPNGSVEVLRSHKSTHQKECIYATDNKVVALLFMAKGNGDLDTRISNVNGQPELVERRSGVLERLYNRDGYLYELDGTTFEHYDYLWSLEVISFEKEIKPLRKIYYPNILDAIMDEEKKKNIIIYRYPDRPLDMPLDNSDLIERYISFEEQGIKGAVADLLRVYPEFLSDVENFEYQKTKFWKFRK